MVNSPPKKRYPLGRVARLTFRTLALAMLLLLLVDWVVSYRIALNVSRLNNDVWLTLGSSRGRLVLSSLNPNSFLGMRLPLSMMPRWGLKTTSPRIDPRWRKVEPFTFRVGESDYERFSVSAPYWFLTALPAMATAWSFKRTWRFTTRQLLLATTAVALLLGAVAWSMRG